MTQRTASKAGPLRAAEPVLKTATSGSLHHLVSQSSAVGSLRECHAPRLRLFWVSRFNSKFRKSTRGLSGPLHIGYAAASRFELLEARTVLSNGPIPTVPTPAAHWTFDEGTGTTAADSSGNGHTATLGAGATWTAGNVGTNAISLTGTATGVATATGPVVNTAGNFTVSAWVKLASLSGYQTVVSIAGTNVAGFFLQLRGDTGTFAFSRLPSDAAGRRCLCRIDQLHRSSALGITLSALTTQRSGTLTLYVDGRSMGSVAYTRRLDRDGQHADRPRILRRQSGRLRQRFDRRCGVFLVGLVRRASRGARSARRILLRRRHGDNRRRRYRTWQHVDAGRRQRRGRPGKLVRIHWPSMARRPAMRPMQRR